MASFAGIMKLFFAKVLKSSIPEIPTISKQSNMYNFLQIFFVIEIFLKSQIEILNIIN